MPNYYTLYEGEIRDENKNGENWNGENLVSIERELARIKKDR